MKPSATKATALQRLREALNRRNHTAFVFSGGGNLGAVQVGMLRALVERGIEPDVIVGCSVGAINGAAFAAEPTLRGLIHLDGIWGRLADGQPDLMPDSRLPIAVQLASRKRSLHDPRVLEAFLEEELPVDRFEALKVPFACVATKLSTADEHWFDTGRLVPALIRLPSGPLPDIRFDEFSMSRRLAAQAHRASSEYLADLELRSRA